MAPQIYLSQPSTYQHGFLCPHVCKKLQWTMAGPNHLRRSEEKLVMKDCPGICITTSFQTGKSPVSASLKFLPHSVIKRLCIWILVFPYTSQSSSICGVAAGLALPVSFILLPAAQNSHQ